MMLRRSNAIQEAIIMIGEIGAAGGCRFHPGRLGKTLMEG